MGLKICVYAICKNEAQFVDRWMDSMNEADLVVVTDTGSTDETVKKLRARGALVFVEEVKPWRFDVGRNLSLGHVPEDMDICVCTDLDEVFRKGWRRALEKAWGSSDKEVCKQACYTYNWSLEPIFTFTYTKIHSRHGWIWKYPIHEYIFLEANKPLQTIEVPEIILDHYPDKSKSRADYLPLLKLAVVEAPLDGRMMNLLGREYFVLGQYEDAIETLKRYLELPDTVRDEDRGQSMRWIANSHFQLGHRLEAEKWFFKALIETGHRREPYVDFAKMAHHYENWPLVYYLVSEAMKITETFDSYFTLSFAWDETIYDLAAQACYHLGMLGKALEYSNLALAMNKESRFLQEWNQLIKSALGVGISK